MITFPIIELLDRLVIAKIKMDKTNGANQSEYDYYAEQASHLDLTVVKPLLDRLEDVHLSIWELESDLRRGMEHNLGYEEIGRRAVEIRNYNNIRVNVKNNLAEALGDTVREIKYDHISDKPAS
jgi:hypothetical protein